MTSEKRTHPRFLPDGLIASIAVKLTPPDKEIVVEGKIIDMSYTGIKIQLNTPLPSNISTGEIRIMMIMPQSGLPISIHGIIRHCSEQGEYGLNFSGKHAEHHIDNLMFECIKLARQSVQQQSEET